jgi:hypothetical protein
MPLTTLRTRCAIPTRWRSARHASPALSRRTKPIRLVALPARSHHRHLHRPRRPLQHHQAASPASALGTQSPWQTTLTLKSSKDPSAIRGKITISVLSVSPVVCPSNACGFTVQQQFDGFSLPCMIVAAGWVNSFRVGTGTFTVWESTGGTRGAQLLSMSIPLTPGPLVVVIKDGCPNRNSPTNKCAPAWPPSKSTAVETIAASFVPPKSGSAVRLFNLAADVQAAGLTNGASKTLVSGVKFTLGSVWAPIPAASDTFTATSTSGDKLASAPMTPPLAPQVRAEL